MDRNGREEIKEYFDFFLQLKPYGHITEIIEEDFGYRRIAVVNGLYNFDLTEDGEKAGAKWKIHSHPSSKQP